MLVIKDVNHQDQEFLTVLEDSKNHDILSMLEKRNFSEMLSKSDKVKLYE